jgi:hypothetical protein
LNTGIPRVTIVTFLCLHILGDRHPRDDSSDASWFASDAAVDLVTHLIEQLRLKDALGDSQGVVYREYRRVPSEDAQHETFEMLRLHRC